MKTHHHYISLKTGSGIQVHDITPELRRIIRDSGIQHGQVVTSSMHTTLALTVNEAEERLLIDIQNFFTKLAPPNQGYLHDDLHLRDVPPDEPENAHSHLIAMMLGNSESLAVANGEPVLGTYQSLMAVELDGPRERKVSVQIVGV